MQSVDESYSFVSLEADAGMAGGDRRGPAEREAPATPADPADPADPAHPAEPAEGACVFTHYPPHQLRELGEENGIHYFEDGHFYTEVGPPFCESTVSYSCQLTPPR